MQTKNSVKPMKAMVLAAGVGSRLDPLTRLVPKPLVPIGNRPVMEHILRLLSRHGVTEVISNLYHLPEKVPDYFGSGTSYGLDLSYHKEEKLSGDAGGVRACRSFLEADGTFIVIMGDLVTDADLSYVIEQHRSKGAIATVALQKVKDVSRFGVAVLNDHSFITRFQEKPAPEAAISDLASTGIYILEPEIFNHMPREAELSFGRQLFPQLVENGLPVLGVQVYGYWSDIGTVCDYRRANFEALTGMIDIDLPGSRTPYGWIGDNSWVAESAHIRGTVILGDNSTVEEGVILSGSVIIGDNCRICSGARLEDSIIWSGTDVGSRAHISNSVIGANCEITPNRDIVGEISVAPVKRLAAMQLLGRTEPVRSRARRALAS